MMKGSYRLFICLLTALNISIARAQVNDTIPSQRTDTLTKPTPSSVITDEIRQEPYDLLQLADDIARTWRHTGRRIRKEVKKFNAIDTTYIKPNKVLAVVPNHTGATNQVEVDILHPFKPKDILVGAIFISGKCT